MVAERATEAELRQEGFDEEAIEFASEQREKSKEQLEREGWDQIAVDFILKHGGRTSEQLEAQGMPLESISTLESLRPLFDEAHEEVMTWHSDREVFEEKEKLAAAQDMRGRVSYETHLRNKLHDQLLRQGFSLDTLRHFAGPTNRYRTERDLAREGVTLSAMGLSIPNQPFNPPPPPSYQDPWGLEAEGVVTQANRASRRLWLGLKYWEGLPVLRKARMLSKPTKRITLTSYELGRLMRGHAAAKGQVKPLSQVGECLVVSTDRGVMELRECVERRVGGMVLCRIW